MRYRLRPTPPSRATTAPHRLLALAAIAALAACGRSEKKGPTEPESTTETTGARAALNGSLPHPWVGKLISIQSNLITPAECLDVEGGVAVSGQNVNHFRCHGGLNQQFWVRQIPTTPTRTYAPMVALVSAQDPNLCLDVRGGTANGSEHLQLYTCHFGTGQSFGLPAPRWSEDTFGPISTEVSGWRMVLDVPLPVRPGYVQQYPNNWGINQRWSFIDVQTGRLL